MSDDSKGYISLGQAIKEKTFHDKLKISNNKTDISNEISQSMISEVKNQHQKTKQSSGNTHI